MRGLTVNNYQCFLTSKTALMFNVYNISIRNFLCILAEMRKGTIIIFVVCYLFCLYNLSPGCEQVSECQLSFSNLLITNILASLKVDNQLV